MANQITKEDIVVYKDTLPPEYTHRYISRIEIKNQYTITETEIQKSKFNLEKLIKDKLIRDILDKIYGDVYVSLIGIINDIKKISYDMPSIDTYNKLIWLQNKLGKLAYSVINGEKIRGE